MERNDIARFPLPCKGHIPNFVGADQAARNLRQLDVYRRSSTILVCPDSPQTPVRETVLRGAKTLVMASPRLKKGFVFISASSVHGREREVSTIRGAFMYGRIIDVAPLVDLVIEGSVAVDAYGNRLGKGGGYGDREIRSARIANPKVVVATTCHSMQVVESVPAGEADEKVDYIVTERGVIKITRK